jgi:hypothetical protein
VKRLAAELTKFDIQQDRIKRLLPRSHDPTLVLHKGHLLVEEQLFACIAAHCPDATKLEDARLTFAQKLRLAQALCGLQSVAHSLEKLNALRNRMAHRVEVPDFDSRLDDYLKAWAKDEFVQPKTRRERTRRLRNTLMIQIAWLAGVSEAAEYFRQLRLPQIREPLEGRHRYER